jgi:hypothetical protein
MADKICSPPAIPGKNNQKGDCSGLFFTKFLSVWCWAIVLELGFGNLDLGN